MIRRSAQVRPDCPGPRVNIAAIPGKMEVRKEVRITVQLTNEPGLLQAAAGLQKADFVRPAGMLSAEEVERGMSLSAFPI